MTTMAKPSDPGDDPRLDAPLDDQEPEEGRDFLDDEYGPPPDIRVITVTWSQEGDWRPEVDHHSSISPWEVARLLEEALAIKNKELEAISAYTPDTGDE